MLLRTADQLSAALALIALDGVAARIVIAPPDLKAEHLPDVIERAEIDTLVTDGDAIDGLTSVTISTDCSARRRRRQRDVAHSEWVMFTSGTTGAPKMVAHTPGGLTGAIKPATRADIVWGTFYDIRRYGGLQILLRALLGGASLILSDAGRSRRRFPGAPGPARRHPSDRHAVALAPRPDEPGQSPRSRRAMSACRARSPTRRCWTV